MSTNEIPFFWNYVFSIAQAAGSIATGAALFFVWNQSRQTQKQVEYTQKQMEYTKKELTFTLRSWLFLSKIEIIEQSQHQKIESIHNQKTLTVQPMFRLVMVTAGNFPLRIISGYYALGYSTVLSRNDVVHQVSKMVAWTFPNLSDEDALRANIN